MYRLLCLGVPLWLSALAPLTATADHDEWQAKFDCERAAADADLILVARVEEVSKITLMRGGKGESFVHQYRFKPLRVIKGVYAREELTMTSGDLALDRFSGSGSSQGLAKGEVRLMFLGRNSEGYQNTMQFAGRLELALPPLRDEHDPLLNALDVLLAIHAEPDRARRVARLIEAVRVAEGPGTVPLCFALQRRSLLAAQNPATALALTRHLQASEGSAVQEVAAHTLGRLMDVDYLRRTDLRATAATELAALLQESSVPAPVRAAAAGALGSAGTEAVEATPLALSYLHVDPPAATGMEQGTRVAMIGWLHLPGQQQAVGDAFLRLPLDENQYAAFDYARAFARADPARAARELPARMREILAAHAGTIRELIESLQELPPKSAVETLLNVVSLPLDSYERLTWASTCTEVTRQERDERFVEPLSRLITDGDPSVTWHAAQALMRIDTLRAAEVLRPTLRQETNLGQKLRLAEFLGRHGFRDGYPYAIEHLSENGLTELAIAALVAIREPDAVTRLEAILESSNDLAWRSAALRALGALKSAGHATQFADWAADFKNPLAPAALLALADLGDRRVAGRVREGLASRNDGIVIASATAAGKLLATGDPALADLGDSLANLLADTQADYSTRAAALEALFAAHDPRLDHALVAAETDAKLENTSLLERVESLLRERKIAVLP